MLPWRGRLWHNPAFRRFWLAQAFGQVGGLLAQFLLPSVAILALRAGPLQVGLIAAVENVPYLAFGLVAGVVADRLSRRDIIVAAGIGRALVLGAVALAAKAGWLSIWQLLLAAGLAGICTMFFAISYQAYVPEVVARPDLIEANAKIQTTQSIAELTGPALAGVAIVALGVAGALALNACCHLIAALALVGASRPVGRGKPRPYGVAEGIREGIALVWENRSLRGLAVTSTVLNFGYLMFTTLLLLYAYRDLRLPPAQVGLAVGFGSIGLLVGVATAPSLVGRLGVGWTLALACWSIGSGILLTTLATVAVPLLVLAGARTLIASQWPVYIITDASFRHVTVPLALQGRLNATLRVCVLGIGPASSLGAGFAAARFGTAPALAIAGVVVMVSCVWALRSPLVRLRLRPAGTGWNEDAPGRTSAGGRT
jgi:MFS family permease